MSDFEIDSVNPWVILIFCTAVFIALEFLDSKWSFLGTNSFAGWVLGVVYFIAGMVAFVSLFAIYDYHKS